MAIIRGTEANDQLNGTAGDDIIYGLGGSDTLNGGAGNDTLYGGGGFNDYLDGGTGADKMFGGVGDSTYFVDNVGDQIFEYDENGTDKVVSTISYAMNDDQFIEDLYLSAGIGNLNGSGNWLSNLIVGNDSDNLLSGKAGVDTLRGNAGNDTLDGGDDSDNLYGGEGVDTLFGGRGEDNLYGGEGNDILNGGIQNDYLDGEAGADVMTGGSGSDDYNVDNVGDRIVENDEAGFDEVYSTVSYTLGSQFIENLYLRGESDLNGTGNNQKNEIGGNDGNNTLYGLGGDDHLLGGLGNDILVGGLGNDRLDGSYGNDSYYVDSAGDEVTEDNIAGVDKVYSTISYSISGQFIENLTLTGSANINGTGNSLANIVTGNTGSNVLNGGLGNDTLSGGAGADRFVFNTAPGTTNVDKITDFNVPGDAIWMDNAVFTALGANGLLAASAFHIGAAAHDANDRIIYNSATGALFYDSNGSAAGGSVQFATLSKGLAMTNADFLIV